MGHLKNSHLLKLGLVALLMNAASATRADVSLACYGIGNEFLTEANRAIGKMESSVNQFASQQVSLLNFDLGSTQFGIQGTAGLGNLHVPEFKCSKPKEILKSGMADFGLTPQYNLTARIFGLPVNVVDARLEGGQGPRTQVNAEATNRKNKLRVSVKVLGIDVLSKVRKAPETEAYDPMTTVRNPGDLPSSETTGAGGKLFDITRSLSDSLGGQMPRIDIIPPVLYVGIDAGFFLSADLIFTYGVSSPFFNYSKSFTGKDIRNSLSDNPANATGSFCEAPANATAAACQSLPQALAKKGKDFYTNLRNQATTTSSNITKLRQQVREVKTSELLSDALKARDALGADWTRVTGTSMTVAERTELIKSIDFKDQMRPAQDQAQKLRGIYDQAKGVVSSVTERAEAVARVANFLKGEDGSSLPEIRATAGLAISGKVGGWASALLVLDLVVAKGYAGIQGYLTLIDIRAGLGASLSSKSQYVDLTASLEQIRLMGKLDLVYGVSIGFAPMETKYEGRINLFEYLGSMSQQEWLAGRLDFRAPAGKPMLFWCWNLFGSSAVDPQRCGDGDVSRAEILPGLVAHAAFKKDYFKEETLDEEASCLISKDGKVISSVEESNCSDVLPDPALTLLQNQDGSEHVLAKSYEEDPANFMSFLRNSDNKPILVLTANSGSGQPVSKVYLSLEPSPAPIAGNPVLTFGTIVNEVDDQPGASISKRINSFSAIKVPVVRQVVENSVPVARTVYGTSANQDLLIDMDFAAATDPVYGGQKIFVGDLLALPNNVLVEMAEDYKLGRCQAIYEPSDILIKVLGRQYPNKGDPAGKVSVNMTDSTQICYPGGSSNQQEYAACLLRTALFNQECFPADRVVDLVTLANLSDEDKLRFFLAAPGSPDKLISGEIIRGQRAPDMSIRRRNKAGYTYSPSQQSGWRAMYGDSFGGTGQGVDPWHQADWQRCNIHAVGDNSGQATTHWWETRYVGNGAGEAYRELYLNSRDLHVCFEVKNYAVQNSRNHRIGGPDCNGSNVFRATYSHHPNNSPHARVTPQLCNSSHPGHRDNFHTPILENFKVSAASNLHPTGYGKALVRAIGDCMLEGECKYTPDVPYDASGTFASTCAMELRYSSSSVPMSGPADSQSIAGCIQQSSSPNFADANVFCQDPNAKSAMRAMIGNRTGNYNVDLVVKWSSTNQVDANGNINNSQSTEQAIGKCFVNMTAGNFNIITGQSYSNVATTLAGGANGSASSQFASCGMNVMKDAAAQQYFVRNALKDNISNPDTSLATCWSTLGFEASNPTQNQTAADDTCKALPSNTLIRMFGDDAALDTEIRSSSAPALVTRNALLKPTLFQAQGPISQACEIKLTPNDWKDRLDGGSCSLYLVPGVFTTTNSQRISITTQGRGKTACITALAAYTCNTIKALPQYLPFSNIGSTIHPQYGETDAAQSFNCSGAYNANADQPATNNACVAKLRLSNPNESGPYVTAPLVSTVQNVNSSSCNSAWATTYNRTITTGATISDRTPASGISNELFCAQYKKTVETRLINTGRVRPTSLTAAGVNLWSDPKPYTGVISVNVTTEYNNQNSQQLFTCDYEFNLKTAASPTQGATWVFMTRAESLASTTRNETPTELICLKKSGSDTCETPNANSTLVFGGAGAAYLGQGALGSAEEYCTAYMTQMSPLSDLEEPSLNRRFPMWILPSDPHYTVRNYPTQTSTPTHYCVPKDCSVTAQYNSLSVSLTLPWADQSEVPVSSSACNIQNSQFTDRYCALLADRADLPDNHPIDIYSTYGTNKQLLTSCAPSGPARQCKVKLVKNVDGARGVGEPMLLEERKYLPVAAMLGTVSSSAVIFTPGTNNLASCQSYAEKMNSWKPLCQRVSVSADEISRGWSYTAVLEFGGVTQTYQECPPWTKIVIVPPPVDPPTEKPTDGPVVNPPALPLIPTLEELMASCLEKLDESCLEYYRRVYGNDTAMIEAKIKFIQEQAAYKEACGNGDAEACKKYLLAIIEEKCAAGDEEACKLKETIDIVTPEPTVPEPTVKDPVQAEKDRFLAMTNDELWELGLKRQVGKCGIQDKVATYGAYYVNTTNLKWFKPGPPNNINTVGLPGQNGIPYGTGYISPNQYPTCWGAPNTFTLYNGTDTPVCTTSPKTNGANLIRIALKSSTDMCDIASLVAAAAETPVPAPVPIKVAPVLEAPIKVAPTVDSLIYLEVQSTPQVIIENQTEEFKLGGENIFNEEQVKE